MLEDEQRSLLRQKIGRGGSRARGRGQEDRGVGFAGVAPRQGRWRSSSSVVRGTWGVTMAMAHAALWFSRPPAHFHARSGDIDAPRAPRTPVASPPHRPSSSFALGSANEGVHLRRYPGARRALRGGIEAIGIVAPARRVLLVPSSRVHPLPCASPSKALPSSRRGGHVADPGAQRCVTRGPTAPRALSAELPCEPFLFRLGGPRCPEELQVQNPSPVARAEVQMRRHEEDLPMLLDSTGSGSAVHVCVSARLPWDARGGAASDEIRSLRRPCHSPQSTRRFPTHWLSSSSQDSPTTLATWWWTWTPRLSDNPSRTTASLPMTRGRSSTTVRRPREPLPPLSRRTAPQQDLNLKRLRHRQICIRFREMQSCRAPFEERQLPRGRRTREREREGQRASRRDLAAKVSTRGTARGPGRIEPRSKDMTVVSRKALSLHMQANQDKQRGILGHIQERVQQDDARRRRGHSGAGRAHGQGGHGQGIQGKRCEMWTSQ